MMRKYICKINILLYNKLLWKSLHDILPWILFCISFLHKVVSLISSLIAYTISSISRYAWMIMIWLAQWTGNVCIVRSILKCWRRELSKLCSRNSILFFETWILTIMKRNSNSFSIDRWPVEVKPRIPSMGNGSQVHCQLHAYTCLVFLNLWRV